jgi:hypothetical protein
VKTGKRPILDFETESNNNPRSSREKWEAVVIRNLQTIITWTAIGVFVTASGAFAHHSFSAEFDSTKQVTLKGTITKVEWMNPHTYFYMDAIDENGKAGNWAVEGGAPNVLYRQGWKPDSLKAGIKQPRRQQSQERFEPRQCDFVRFADGRCVFRLVRTGRLRHGCGQHGVGRGGSCRGMEPPKK